MASPLERAGIVVGIVVGLVGLPAGIYWIWEYFHPDPKEDAFAALAALDTRVAEYVPLVDRWVALNVSRDDDHARLGEAERLQGEARMQCGRAEYGECRASARQGLDELEGLDPDSARKRLAREHDKAHEALQALAARMAQAEREATGNDSWDGVPGTVHLQNALLHQDQALAHFAAARYREALASAGAADRELDHILLDSAHSWDTTPGLPAGAAVAALAAALALAALRRRR